MPRSGNSNLFCCFQAWRVENVNGWSVVQ